MTKIGCDSLQIFWVRNQLEKFTNVKTLSTCDIVFGFHMQESNLRTWRVFLCKWVVILNIAPYGSALSAHEFQNLIVYFTISNSVCTPLSRNYPLQKSIFYFTQFSFVIIPLVILFTYRPILQAYISPTDVNQFQRIYRVYQLR